MTLARYFPQHFRQTRPYVKTFLAEVQALREANALDPERAFDASAKAILAQYPREALQPGSPQFDAVRFTAENQALLAYGEWVQQGAAVYDFDPQLVGALEASALGEVTLTDLSFPFAAAYFHFGARAGLTLQTGAEVTGAFLLYARGHSLRVVLTAPLVEDQPGSERYAEVYDLRIPVSFFDDSVDVAIARALQADIDDLKAAEAQLKAQPHSSAAVLGAAERLIQAHQAHHDTYLRCVQLMVNGLCYLTAFPEDAEERWQLGTPERLRIQAEQGTPKEQNRARSKLNAMGFQRIRYIGQDFHEASDSAQRAPHWRRGHWRRQAHGPQRSQRRLTWIRPTRVLGGVFEEEPRVYEVKPPR